MRSPGCVPIQYDWCPDKKGKFDTEVFIEGRQWEETQGEYGRLQSQEERPGTDPALPALARNRPCRHLDFGLPASSTVSQ